MKTITLFRPVGEKELVLIAESGFKKFPPRLEWQPIFYPVLNEDYAAEIASEWNTKDEFGNYLGFVTKFSISEEEFLRYEVQTVGGERHKELWVPAHMLDRFNTAIIDDIKVTKVFIGSKFENTTNDTIEQVIDELKEVA